MAEAEDPEPQVILVVEDEVLIRMSVADYLRECGYEVVEAANGDEAVKILQSGRSIHLVFSDIQMPGSMDGFALSRFVRENYPHIRVILTSGVVRTAEIAGEVCEDGPIEGKPFHPQQLLTRIRSALGTAAASRKSSSSRSA